MTEDTEDDAPPMTFRDRALWAAIELSKAHGNTTTAASIIAEAKLIEAYLHGDDAKSTTEAPK